MIPNFNPAYKPADEKLKHSQHFFRLYNRQDGIYRTLIFARERGRDVRVQAVGKSGMSVVTPEYSDYVFLDNEVLDETGGDVRFTGRVGWIRREASGRIRACVPDGEAIAAFGVRIEGRGPWAYNMDGAEKVELKGGPPRNVECRFR